MAANKPTKKEIIKNISHNKVFKNFVYLGILQGFNYVLPLITIPYLIRVLTPEYYGLTVYAQAVMLYFIVFIDYGFNITASRKVTLVKEDAQQLQRTISNTITTKLLLLLISLTVLTILTFTVSKFQIHPLLYAYTAGLLIGQAILPIWLFQGMQDMKFIMYFNIVIRTLSTLLIFVFISKPTQFVYVNLIHSFTTIAISVVSLAYALKIYRVPLRLATAQHMLQEIKDGFVIFVSNFAIQIYVNSSLIILGMYTTDIKVGYYIIAERVLFIMRQLLGVFSQVAYPRICELSINLSSIFLFLKRAYLPFLLGIVLLCSGVFLFAEHIVLLLADTNIAESVTLLKLFSFVPLIITLNIPAYQILLAYNLKNTYSGILIGGSIINVAMNFLFVKQWGSMGIAYSIIITEILVTFALNIAFKLNQKKIIAQHG